MANLRGWQLVILVVLILLLFGSKKLPDAARSLGRSLRIFKAETKALVDEEDGDKGAQAELSSADATDGSGANPSATAAAAEATTAAPVEEPSSQQSGSPKSS